MAKEIKAFPWELIKEYKGKDFVTDADIVHFFSNNQIRELLSEEIIRKIDNLSIFEYRDFFNLIWQLINAYLEEALLEEEIKEDEKVLENASTWKSDEKTEWQHELASKRTFSREDIRMKISLIEEQINAYIESDKHGRSYR